MPGIGLNFLLQPPVNLFPNPRKAPRHAPLARGGDLSPAMLLSAYENGIFPWYSEDSPILWWSPDPRCVMDVEHLHVSTSLARLLRRDSFRITWNHCFSRVMEECGSGREDGTWIFPEMVEAYSKLHHLGQAHSIEVWSGDALAGGLYGVQRGAGFMAESMFHRVRDASKIALATAIATLFAAGIRLFDVQFLTPHLESMGAYEISRNEYLDRLEEARIIEVDLCSAFRALPS